MYLVTKTFNSPEAVGSRKDMLVTDQSAPAEIGTLTIVQASHPWPAVRNGEPGLRKFGPQAPARAGLQGDRISLPTKNGKVSVVRFAFRHPHNLLVFAGVKLFLYLGQCKDGSFRVMQLLELGNSA
ncbi:hypothetical protein HPB48_023159 [Haemaphysalis longicornis]|uniref:Uncharacterized protein n=1 Tax=Haemaphysalis longicornis TaxID=44386 RepID=A0A9J6GQF3_HAELO|nr:hypothetical protein HPB48_023159 [Haemaphysalis longicornis]